MILGGLVSLITGLIMIAWPGKTLLFVAVLIGVWLLVMGAVRLVQAFTRRDLSRNRRLLIGVAGLLYLTIGAICLRDMFKSLVLLTVIVGLVWMIGGGAEIASGFPRFWPTLLGLLSIGIGITVLVWPEPTLTLITILVGIWLLAIGIVQLGLAFVAWRRRHDPPDSPAPLAPA